jgi:hypothetical protein
MKGFMKALVVGLVVVVAGGVGDAFAQPGGRGAPGMGGMMGRGGEMLPAYSGRQITQYSTLLGLDKEQKDVVMALLEGYSQQATLANREMRQQSERIREEFRDTRDPAVWGRMREVTTKFRDARQKLDTGFMGDFQAILTEEQAAKWPAVERAARRDQTMRWGRLSGERVDLVAMFEQGGYDPAAKQLVAGVLSDYEQDLDRELQRRNEVYEKAMQTMMNMARDMDMQAMQDAIEEGRRAGTRVRDLNRRYARQIADVLPDGEREKFNTQFQRESFPDIYRETAANRTLTAAKGFADLTTSQKEEIDRMTMLYQRENTALAAKLAAAVEETENRFNIAEVFARGGRGNANNPQDDLRRQRRELERRTTDALRALLTEDQIQRLPNVREDDQGGGWRERGGEGGGAGGGRNRT